MPCTLSQHTPIEMRQPRATPPTKLRTTYHEPTIHTMILLPRPNCASEGRTDVSERSEDTSLMIELAPHLPFFAALKPAANFASLQTKKS